MPLFGRNRGRGAQNAQAAQGTPPAFTVSARSRKQADRITFADMSAGQAFANDREFLLGYYEIPKHELVRVQRMPYRLYLRGKVEGSGTNDASSTETIDLGSAHSVNAIRSVRAAPSLPATGHPDVRAFTTTDGGSTWTEQNIAAYDAAANTVEIAKPTSTAYDYKIYVLVGSGQLRATVDAPAGSGAIQTQLANTTLAALHEVDQAQANAAQNLPALFGREILLSEEFRIGLYVTSSVEIPFTAEAGHDISVPIYRRSVEVHSRRQMVRETLQRLGV